MQETCSSSFISLLMSTRLQVDVDLELFNCNKLQRAIVSGLDEQEVKICTAFELNRSFFLHCAEIKSANSLAGV